jgi:hypothetical protein
MQLQNLAIPSDVEYKALESQMLNQLLSSNFKGFNKLGK